MGGVRRYDLTKKIAYKKNMKALFDETISKKKLYTATDIFTRLLTDILTWLRHTIMIDCSKQNSSSKSVRVKQGQLSLFYIRRAATPSEEGVA